MNEINEGTVYKEVPLTHVILDVLKRMEPSFNQLKAISNKVINKYNLYPLSKELLTDFDTAAKIAFDMNRILDWDICPVAGGWDIFLFLKSLSRSTYDLPHLCRYMVERHSSDYEARVRNRLNNLKELFDKVRLTIEAIQLWLRIMGKEAAINYPGGHNLSPSEMRGIKK